MFGNLLVWAIEEAHLQHALALVATKPEAFIAKLAEHVKAMSVESAAGSRAVQVYNNTAVVRLNGVMHKAESRRVRLALREAVDMPDVDNIVLAVDSPGGQVDGTMELAAAVEETNQTKAIIVQIDGMMASAAYWVGSQASAIYANTPDTLIGSIGVRVMMTDWSAFFEKHGIESIPIDTGPFKSAGAMGTKVTEAQKADFQSIVDGIFEEFKAAITAGRQIVGPDLDAVSDGRVFLARDAQKLGLIDGIQTMETTLKSLRRPEKRGRSTATAKLRLRIAGINPTLGE